MPDRALGAAIAVTRFGLGAKPGEIARVAGGDPKAWLTAQIRTEGAPNPSSDLPSGQARLARFFELRAVRQQIRATAAGQEGSAPTDGDPRAARRAARQARMAGQAPAEAIQPSPEPMAAPVSQGQDMALYGAGGMPNAPAQDPVVREVGQAIRAQAGEEFGARLVLACRTDAPFAERWALFWSNALTVSGAKPVAAVAAGPYEREAIRPNCFGRFEDLLVASTRHPAMLLYLDQAQSIGPNSPAGQRRGRGLNENLAREILELHTLGVGGGYSQADVTEFARALTGWSVGYGQGRFGGEPGAYTYRQLAHEPGARTILGRSYREGGEEQARAVLRDIAADPRTARRLCGRIAEHFVADDPPPALVERLNAAWTRSAGRLDEVARALVEAPEAWAPTAAKLKAPYEYLVSAWRSVGAVPQDLRRVAALLTGLGQRPFSPASPAGWAETADAWASPSAMVKRLEFAEAFGAAANAEPMALAETALGARLTPPTEQAIRRAENRPEGLTLLLMSPEFQRR